MPFDLTVARTRSYVRYKAAGATSLKKFGELFTFIGDDTARFEDEKILVDLTRVVGRLTPHEQRLLGEIAAVKLRYVFKMASLVPVGEMTGNSERAAILKGLAVKVFESEAEAIAWLTKPEVA